VPWFHLLGAEPTPLLGRTVELATIEGRFLRDHVRLLTLIGPPGIGKTRLGREAGARLADQFADGVTLVDLSLIRDPSMVLPTIAHSLGIRDSGKRPLLDRLGESLHDREMLLILDNLEQVLLAAGQLAQLLVACPGIRLLVTSRVALGLRWEHTLRVEPLPLPDLDSLPAMEELIMIPSVALFLERVRAQRADFTLTEGQAALVAQLVNQLDGLPLAIELAAVHMNVLPLAVVTRRLQDRMQLLRWNAQDLPDRHRSLEAAIGWSYDLLTEAEQRLFRYLGVFAGWVSLDAIDAVVSDGDGGMMLGDMVSLAEKSLVLPVVDEDGQGDAEPYFRLLETVREYAEERLRRQGELERARRAHAAYYLTLAERADPELRRHGQLTWILRLDHEHDNLRAVLRWFREQGDGEALLRLASALGYFWTTRGYHSEGRRWLDEALRKAPDADLAIRTKALLAAGHILPPQGDFDRAREVLEEALTLAQQAQDRYAIAEALTCLGFCALQTGDLTQSGRLLQEALDRWQELGDHFQTGFALAFLGAISFRQGNYARAASLYSDALAHWEAVGEMRIAGEFSFHLALVMRELGDLPRAVQLMQDGVRVTLTFQDRWFLSLGLGAALLLIGDQVDPEQRARLVGARDVLHQATGSVPGVLERLSGQTVVGLREQLEQEGLGAAYREGRSLPFVRIAALTQATLEEFSRTLERPEPTQEQQPRRESVVSGRELEVLRLVAEGLSNKAIGRQLFISTSTVNHHLTSIFQKLDVDARAQAVAVAAQQGLL